MPSYFRDSFIVRHALDFQSIRKMRYLSNDTGGELASGVRVASLLPKEEVTALLTGNYNLIAPQRFDYHELRQRIPSSLNVIFNDNYLRQFEMLSEEAGSNTIAIHYRGGDVIYGEFRSEKRVAFNKSLSLCYVEYLIRQNQSSDILLFGTPVGDTLCELIWLKERYSNVRLALDITNRDFDGVIQDSYLMSCCGEVHAAQGTAVTALASLFRPCLRIVERLSAQEEFALLSDVVHRNAYAEYFPLQKSYTNIHLYLLGTVLGCSEEALKEFVNAVDKYDPANKKKWL